MISTAGEVSAALAVLDQAGRGRRPMGLEVGRMVEVPSVALKAGQLVPLVDFFSLDTNDLTQPTLAVGLGNPALVHPADPLDAGVLRLTEELCREWRACRSRCAVNWRPTRLRHNDC
jgi:phosphoenolpyruvate-protein kinase (PTS system EI component)